MLGPGCFDNWTEHLGAAHLEANGDDLDALSVYFVAQCLPPGQVEAAASVGRPAGEHHLLSAKR
jgi:hypothetical protein